MQDLCRICLKSTSPGIPIFTTKIANSDIFVGAFLTEIANLEIKETDPHPKYICSQCYNKLNDVSTLINQCKNSDKCLRDGLFKPDDEDDKPLIFFVVKGEPLENARTQLHISNDEANDDTFDHDSSPNSPIFIQKFCCALCTRSFKSEHSLKKHESGHKRRRHYTCKHCKRRCTSWRGYKNHVKVHERNYVVIAHTRPHKCALCPKSFPYKSGLKRHMRSGCHNVEDKPHKVFACTECTEVYPNRRDLKRHLKTHRVKERNICTVCGKTFRDASYLKIHQKRHSGDYVPPEKSFQCETCGQKFSWQSLLKYHMRKHTNERPFVCQTCGATFSEKPNLNRHEKKHLGLLSVLCTVCGKKMATAYNLTIHMRSHSGERPFSCMACAKRFATRPLLKRHERVHTGEKPYVCEVCGKAFNQTNALKSHKEIHHKRQERNEDYFLKLERERVSAQ